MPTLARSLPFAPTLAAVLLLGVSARAETGEVHGPELVHHDEAAFPDGPVDESEVELELLVDVHGGVVEVRVTRSGGAPFDEAAERAARAYRFRPATQAGVPVAARVLVPFHFKRSRAPQDAPKVEPTPPPSPERVSVRGGAREVSRGGSDYDVRIGKLALVPRGDAASLLRLAPGVLLTNEGGTGHPYQIFLRGFDAREGQDIEFSVDGIPINEVGNVHGNGLADTHFLPPEAVLSLRVVEGPYAPQQGNFAVAGSAQYDVGLPEAGIFAKTTLGSFGTRRLLLGFRPKKQNAHTFAMGELFQSDGFGANRASKRASVIGGYETQVGDTGLFRVLAQSYATSYAQAGLLRQDDVAAGRKGFYDTYDSEQGGDATRTSLGATYTRKLEETRLSQSAFVILRDFRLRENFTGFLNDPQRSWQSPHVQRGDLIDQRSNAVTVGARSSARHGFSWLDRRQEVEVGLFARLDMVDGNQQRNRSGTTIPYRRELALDSALSNIALYTDASLSPLPKITFRGGARADFFHYRVDDRCALTSPSSFGGDPVDTECFASDRLGYRSPDQTTSTASGLFQPRATVLVGPFDGFLFSASRGTGARSLDPQYVDQRLVTPFAEAVATEGAVTYRRDFDAASLEVRSVFFSTSVDKDLFFNQTEGRNTLADGTTRTGFAGSARATGRFFDVAGSVTLVNARFSDTGLPIPYAPPVVARWDGVLFSALPFRVGGTKPEASLGTGISYVGRRPLPFDERSDVQLLVDAAAQVSWKALTLGITCTNLLGRQYRIGEYNYVSDFRSAPYPTLVPARHFSAGEPRAVYASLTITFGRESKEDGS